MATKKVKELAEAGKTIRLRFTLIEPMLGTASASPEVYSDFIGKKAPDAKSMEEEIAALGVEKYVENALTVFCRDQDGTPILWDYMIKGFLKNACKAMREVKDTEASKLAAYKTKIDNLIFVFPRKLRMNLPEGSEITICERPLRASTAQGERVALAASEEIPEGTTMELKIECFNTTVEKLVYELLDYGRYNGLGQWHNSGKGRFVWEELDEDGNVIGGNAAKYLG